jgi:flagellar biosynthetic protein FliR
VGFSVGGVLDPVSQVETPVFGQLLTIVATLLYFQVDGHHLVLLALGSSFQLIPPFGAHLGAPLLTDVTGLIQRTYDIGLKLAFPVMGATFLIHVTMGILGRLVPQMNILLTSFPITIAVGLLVLGLGLPFIALVFQDSIIGMESILWELLQELGHG